MLDLIPLPYRIAIGAFFVVVAGLALAAYGHRQYAKGEAAVQAKWDKQKADDIREAARINARRDTVTAEIAQSVEAKREQIHTVTKTIVREVPTYVSTSDLPLSPGFRVFHDAAAAGELPDASRIADAAAVPIDAIANTVAENYGTCLDTAARLEALQAWVKKQHEVK